MSNGKDRIVAMAREWEKVKSRTSNIPIDWRKVNILRNERKTRMRG